MAAKKSQFGFTSRLLPFLALMGFGSWGLSQFLKLPTQLKDDRRRRKKEGREKFDLHVELERVNAEVGDQVQSYENKRVPGPRPVGRQPAD